MKLGTAAIAAALCLGVACVAAPSVANGVGARRVYVLRSVELASGATRTLATYPEAPEGGTHRGFVDLSPRVHRALMERLVFNCGPDCVSSVVYVADLRGRHGRALATFERRFPPDPSWSPDGRRIGYGTSSSGDECADRTFWSADPDGGDRQPLANGDQFIWGPNGAYAITRHCPNGNYELLVVDQAGTHTISSTPDRVALPLCFSPRGRLIAFAVPGDASSPAVTGIARSDGSGLSRVLEYADFPRWSPDGRRLAFRARTNFVNGVLTVGGPLGEHPRRLVSGRVNWFAWSPDGSKIAFTRNHDVELPNRATLEIVGRNGHGHRVVARTENLGRLWWSPDGRRLYYAAFVSR